jgi:pyruvate ferredoxin oxidoreductase beta subunit
MMGAQLAMEARGLLEDKKLVVLTGEGRTLEMGSGDFIAAFDREQRVTFIILDNQAYANSGSAATPTTPLRASTRIFSRPTGGRPTAERNMPMMMIFGKARYVATAVSAYVRDLVVKVQEALQNQPSYLNIVVPCQVSWGYAPDQIVQVSRKMVQTGMVPLWSFKNGVFKRTVKIPKDQRIPVSELLELQRRYANVSEEDIRELEAHIDRKNKLVDIMEAGLTGPDTVSW